MVDPSLLRQAADRGVTICFADLDGADGLWVPEERTVLVSRRLSEREVAAVIEHELGHVMIDDQHADLDAGREVIVGRPASRRSTLVTAGVSAAAVLAVVAGVGFGLMKASGRPVPQEVVAPSQGGLTADESGVVGPSRVTTSPSLAPNGETVIVTVTVPGARPTTVASPSRVPSPTATPTAARTTPRRSVAVPPPAGVSTTTPPVVTATPSPTPEPTPTISPSPVEPSPEPTTPPPTGVGGDDAVGGAVPDSISPSGATGSGTD